MGTAIMHPMPDLVKIFDTWSLWCSGLIVRMPICQK